MQDSYQALTYRNQFRRVLKIALITLLICVVVLVPLLYIWDSSVQERQALRDAKNVVRNMNLLSIQYYGSTSQIADVTRESGMSKDMEQAVYSYSGADGSVHLVSWDASNNCVSSMNYRKGRFLVEYQYNKKKDIGTYTIYWKVHQYNSEG